MRTQLSSLDLFFLVKELKEFLIGGRIQKVFQDGKKLRIEIFQSGKGTFELYYEPGKLFITEYKRVSGEPGQFAMHLRKHLKNQKIKDIKQHDFDRIIELETDKNILIFELFSKGNVIFCDKDFNIILPLQVQRWKDRQIAPKRPYEYPPSVINPLVLKTSELKELLNEKLLVKFLATDLSFSGLYAEEICMRAKIDKNKISRELKLNELKKLQSTIKEILEESGPVIVFEEEITRPSDVVPFKMEFYKNLSFLSFKTFSQALDKYFTEAEIKTEEKIEEKEQTKEIDRLKRILDEQKETIEKWKRIEKKSKEQANAIYNNFGLVENIIFGLQKAMQQDIGWAEIKARIENEQTGEADSIKEIIESDGIVIINMDSLEIKINFRKSANNNAEKYFEEAKWAKKKLQASKESMEKTEKQIKKLEGDISAEQKNENNISAAKIASRINEDNISDPAKKKKSKEPSTHIDALARRSGGAPHILKKKITKRKTLEWFEKFHWMRTSDGFLVLGGRDATSNEIIFKKHLDENDIVFHADITGAPLTVIKSEGKKISKQAIKEAAVLAASYSSAWKAGLGSVDVYWIKPDQVSKSPPTGEYLPKGAFMIRGKKNYLKKVILEITIGVINISAAQTSSRKNIEVLPRRSGGAPSAAEKNEDNISAGSSSCAYKVISGPEDSIKKQTKFYLTIKPGASSKGKLAKEIKVKLENKLYKRTEKAKTSKSKSAQKLETKIHISLDDITRVLPTGNSKIV